MWPSERGIALVLAATGIAALISPPARAGGGELSVQVQGLGPNAGGEPVLGGRIRFGNWEGSIHSFEYEGLGFTGAYRALWNDNSFLSPSVNFSVRRTETDIQTGPGLSLAFTLFKIGPGRIGVRIDNDLLYSLSSQSFEPEYLIGFTYLIPGVSR
jgi:hypothetical protein